jgi:Family of unknown function (DUF5677)
MLEGTAQTLEEMLGPPVDISHLRNEKSIEKIDAAVFELHKESAKFACVAAHLLDESAAQNGGWPRNQAICAGLMIRLSKFMLVVTQLSAGGDRFEVVYALNRSIMESAINLEFLAKTREEKFFDQFVGFSLGPERELYDVIHTNVAARGGEALPVEQRMLASINNVCSMSGVKIETLNQKYGDWGGGLRARLKAIGKEERYVAMQRLPSHAVHGSWVDLCKYHLDYDSKADVFKPHPDFSRVDARILGPIASLVLEAVEPYLQRYFPGIPETELLLGRMKDLQGRLHEAGDIHENLMSQL